jgi:hypothetical protein
MARDPTSGSTGERDGTRIVDTDRRDTCYVHAFLEHYRAYFRSNPEPRIGSGPLRGRWRFGWYGGSELHGGQSMERDETNDKGR